jgi:formate hydrogenlyase subunit 3/multisubunit Na+/H+ antiporter MnhD subunit
MLSAFWGVAVGITQQDPKTVLAYSSVSQMGLIAAVLGIGLAAGDPSATWAAGFYGAQHVLVKGALFLAIGVAAASRPRPWLVLVPAAVLALGLGGLPLTGGYLAKLAVKAPLGDGLFGTLAALAAAGSTLLMLHFIRRLIDGGARVASPPAGLVWPWLAMALASIAVPWALYPGADALAGKALWTALWPVLLGAALAVALWRWGERLPRLPPGDIVAGGERAVHAAAGWGETIERTDEWLRRWPVASLSLLMTALALGAALLAWR